MEGFVFLKLKYDATMELLLRVAAKSRSPGAVRRGVEMAQLIAHRQNSSIHKAQQKK